MQHVSDITSQGPIPDLGIIVSSQFMGIDREVLCPSLVPLGHTGWKR